MQPRAFEPLALEYGLDVLALQRAFRCSYASVTIRLAEVLRQPPLMAVLYEREDEGDPAGWPEPPGFRATVVRRDAGLRDARLLPHLRRAGRLAPQGQAHPLRLPGGAGRPLRHGAIRPLRRLRRHSQARHLEG